jgi:PAS domain S-box-containing protein
LLLLFDYNDGQLFYADEAASCHFSLKEKSRLPAKLLKKIKKSGSSFIFNGDEMALKADFPGAADFKAEIKTTFAQKIIEITTRSAFSDVLSIEGMLKQFAESASHSLIVVDCQGKILQMNKTCLDWLGYNEDEVVACDIVQKLHRKEELAFLKTKYEHLHDKIELDEFKALFFEASQKQVSQQIFSYLRKDGSSFPVNLTILPVMDAKGQILAYAEIGVDLSTFSNGKNQLVIDEKSMTTIIESAVDGIVIIDQKGIILGFNKAAEKMFCISASQAIGRNVSILMPEPHRSKHNDYIARYLQTGIPHIVGIGRKVDALRANGELFPVDLAVGEVNLDAGKIFTGFVRDLSESQRLESERNSFFEMSLDLFCILDLEGRIKSANPRWLDLLGYTPEAIQRRKLTEFLHPEDKQQQGDLINEILSSPKLAGKNFRFKAQNGAYRWILWNSTFDDRNKAVYGVARDITEQKRILEELERAKNEAEMLSDDRGMFIAKMSHELRTPLNSIIGFSGILQKNLSGHFSQKDLLYLKRIRKNGNALLQLINAILEFAKTESGFQQVYVEEVNLTELVHEIVDLMQVTLQERKIRVVLDFPSKSSFIDTDQVKLRQIIQNLFDNAVKFSEDSTIRIELKADPKDQKPLCLNVIDSGPGISQKHLGRIFAAFQQCDNSVTRRYGGAGLGLAIAKSFADLLGFDLEVDSTPGRGSCFSIIFSQKREGK